MGLKIIILFLFVGYTVIAQDFYTMPSGQIYFNWQTHARNSLNNRQFRDQSPAAIDSQRFHGTNLINNRQFRSQNPSDIDFPETQATNSMKNRQFVEQNPSDMESQQTQGTYSVNNQQLRDQNLSDNDSQQIQGTNSKSNRQFQTQNPSDIDSQQTQRAYSVNDQQTRDRNPSYIDSQQTQGIYSVNNQQFRNRNPSYIDSQQTQGSNLKSNRQFQTQNPSDTDSQQTQRTNLINNRQFQTQNPSDTDSQQTQRTNLINNRQFRTQNPSNIDSQQTQRTNLINNRQFRTQSPSNINSQSSSSLNPFYEFNKKLFHILGPVLSRSNMVYSPLSLQTLLGFIYTGAEADTARELRKALEIPEMPGEVARLFQASLQNIKQQTSQDLKLNMANILYYNDYLTLNEDFYRRSIPYFGAVVEPINFQAPLNAVTRINKMVADMTGQRIKNMISSDALDSDTQAVLVNAIYLKAKWATEFSALDTQMEEFHITAGRTVPVHMMYLDADFKVGELPDLNAKAIELPFKKSSISMLIILPNEIDGLANLESALRSKDLNDISNSLDHDQVTLRMPKFKFEFEIDMTTPLMRLGASRIFTDYAQLDGFFNDQRVRVDKIQHKAYINVNEGGVEAAAASFGKLLPLSLPVKVNYFTIDHPFMFVIRSPQEVYFIGHVTQPLM